MAAALNLLVKNMVICDFQHTKKSKLLNYAIPLPLCECVWISVRKDYVVLTLPFYKDIYLSMLLTALVKDIFTKG